ncbi:unnamed protein product [Rangifer tarandus platyrhynchus]|uniref:Uncharacterized protein n=1 Tax=Rangifer tarandus platyrhynchus TaxID=3082113 RepID=A0ABN8ZAD0_RANTA|nr:unnamed protein product [Rangifer tarandus platyrhynchus]CAI9689180.1 unnamed protein product [Rangifer tarandus platyrhynchus]
MSRSAWLARRPHHPQQVRASHPARPGCCGAPAGHPAARRTTPQSHRLPGPGDTDIRARPEVPAEPPFARSSLRLPLASAHFARVLPSLSPAVASGRWLHPPPLTLPLASSSCSNRTRGSQGCAHLTSGAGVAAQGGAPSSAQRAARSGPPAAGTPCLGRP